jgi:hypothetical protein
MRRKKVGGEDGLGRSRSVNVRCDIEISRVTVGGLSKSLNCKQLVYLSRIRGV